MPENGTSDSPKPPRGNSQISLKGRLTVRMHAFRAPAITFMPDPTNRTVCAWVRPCAFVGLPRIRTQERRIMEIAQALVMAMQTWGIIGAVVAALFLTVGMDRIDEDARGAYIFRPLLIPGVLLIWPLVLWRWWQIETQTAGWAPRYRAVRAWYGPAVVTMSIAIVAIIFAALSARQTWPADAVPVQLSEGDTQ